MSTTPDRAGADCHGPRAGVTETGILDAPELRRRFLVLTHLLYDTSVPLGVLERDVEKAVPDFNTPLVLYCGGGFRSALAADSLQRMGYQNVLSLAGGWSAWVDAGGPVEGAR